MLYLYVSTEMERVFNLKQVHRLIQLNCSGLWESKQKKYFHKTPLYSTFRFNSMQRGKDISLPYMNLLMCRYAHILVQGGIIIRLINMQVELL